MLVLGPGRIATPIALIAAVAVSLGGCGDDSEPVTADLGLDIATEIVGLTVVALAVGLMVTGSLLFPDHVSSTDKRQKE